jgi:hypothetical protein
MKVVYVAGKYRGANRWEVEDNVHAAEHVGIEVARLGAMPLIPQANTRNFDGTLDDDFWLNGTLELMERCDAVMLVKNWRESAGARAEVARAEYIDLPVFDCFDELDEFINGGRGRDPV